MRRLGNVLALLTSVAILLAGNGLQGVLLPVRAGYEGFSGFTTGLLATFYFSGFLLGCLFGARAIGAVGHIRAFTAMTAIATATALGCGFFATPWLWLPLRVVTGFCFAVLYMAIESWLSEASDKESRGFVLSVYMIINLSVICAGQMMLPLFAPRDFELFAVVAMLIAMAAVPVALTRAQAPAPITSTRPRLGHLFHLSPAGVAACLCVGLSTGAFWALAPGFATARGFDEAGIARLMSVTVLAGALGQFPLGWLSDRIDRRWVMALGALGSSAAAAGLALLSSPSAPIIYLLCGLWGACILPIYVIGLAHTNDHGESVDFVETSAGLLLVHAGGSALSPIGASLLGGVIGEGAVFLWPAIVMGLLAGYVLWRRTRTETPAEAEQIRFVEALQAARTVSPVFDEELQADLESAETAAGEADS